MNLSQRVMDVYPKNNDLFEKLPDDIVISILSKLSSIADSPSDLISFTILSKRLNKLGVNPLVLSKASVGCFSLKAINWSADAHNFFNKCITAGNVEASYILGMIQFYCLKIKNGVHLIKDAATKSHALASYSLGVIVSNGSCTSEISLEYEISLYERAISLGHIDALRELGYCILHGYNVEQNIAKGERMIKKANALEWVIQCKNIASNSLKWIPPSEWRKYENIWSKVCKIFYYGNRSDYRCVVPPRKIHPAHKFMKEWFSLVVDGPGHGLQICCFSHCGRPETRFNEFQFMCVGCAIPCYCSNSCMDFDWKMQHKYECPYTVWEDDDHNEDDYDF